MVKARCLMIGAAVVGLAAGALAQFDGPAPLAWRWAASTRVSPGGSPVVEGNTVYVAVGQRIYALDKETGNKKWQYPLVEPINGYFTSGAILTNGMIIAAADNKNIYAVDAATGETKWQHAATVNIIGKPVVAGKFLAYAMSDNTLMAVDMNTGDPAWAAPYRVFDGIAGRISAFDNNILFFTNAFELRAISVVAPERTVWRNKFTVVGHDAEPVVHGDSVYVNTGQYIAVVKGGTGRGSGQVSVGEELAFSPAVSPEGVLLVTRDGKAILLDSNMRPTKKVVELGSLPMTRPTPVGNMFLIPTTNGALNLFDPKSGKIVWSYLVRPMTASSAPPTPAGGDDGGMMAPGGRGGRQQPANNQQQRVVAVQAAGPAVVSGNTLLVLARDGSLLAFDKDTGVDLTAPYVKMLWPTSGELVNGQTIDLYFKIEDEAAGINESTIKIDINGTDVAYTFGRDGIAVVRISPYAQNKSLRNGRQNITITVSDWLGNTSTSKFSLMVDNSLRPTRPPSGTEGTGNPAGGPPQKGGGGALSGGG